MKVVYTNDVKRGNTFSPGTGPLLQLKSVWSMRKVRKICLDWVEILGGQQAVCTEGCEPTLQKEATRTLFAINLAINEFPSLLKCSDLEFAILTYYRTGCCLWKDQDDYFEGTTQGTTKRTTQRTTQCIQCISQLFDRNSL